ncbi:MAG: Crp/Fnr family transcriptional regulator [Pseudonocardia sp.]|nr:Crp/Fnr family transcriptional regulator [Pseudonocardia sp.]
MSTAEQLRHNAILTKLPQTEFDRLCERLEVVDMELHQQLHKPRQVLAEVYFPLSAVVSLVALTDDDRVQVEVATIGWEGMVGLPLFLGAATSPHVAFCQIPGSAARLSADDLRQALIGDGALHGALNRYTQATIVQIAQNVICNSTHPAEQRACRWLLTTHDRVVSDQFPLTQQFLAQMLGVRRPTVSEIASRLQAQGLIRYTRGVITICDRPQLERTTCDCYWIVKAEYDHLTQTK